ncbi:unnamed protein product [Microthlaspi erraticum]|uniref:Reverse transcriptase zinc-binding domain-containing protein n=1 Tax=Microthlaspi erraticum TaxID=1685480 RepID=A0A6D2JL93_9BRAS|nr:unnamed protein product [Microthlaspi erraticum]
MASKLAGWKSRTLSLAGRITLTKSVLCSIPVHSMSSVKLPESTLNRLDRVARDFVWGSTAEKRKQHLLCWDKVCKPKEEGGLGIRKTSLMNIALLAKVGWRVLHDNNSLWSRVLRSKYLIGDIHDTAWLKGKSTWSSTWRSVALGIRDVILPGHKWVLGDGLRVSFWTDKWLMGNLLKDEVVADVPEAILSLKASEMWIPGVGWDIHKLAPYVSDATRLELAAVVVDKVSGRQDRMSWGDAGW